MPNPSRSLTNLVMQVALAACAWSLMIGGHEILGHGGAQLLLGGEIHYVDAMYFDGSELPGIRSHLERAGGSIYNILLGLFCAGWLLRRQVRSPWLRYFLWVSVLYNLFQSGCYIAFGWTIHPGMDWAILSSLAEPVWLGRLAVMFLGGTVLAAGLVFTRRGLGHLLEPGLPVRGQKAWLLVTAWLVSGLVSIPASLLVPSDDRMMMLMGGIGNSLLFMAWSLVMIAFPGPKARSAAPGSASFNWPAFAAASAVALFYVFVMGPGIDFR